MSPWKQVFSGVLWSVLSLAITMGAIILSIAERRPSISTPPTTSPPLPTPNLTPIVLQKETQAIPPPSSATRPPSCNFPSGWVPYEVKPGDTIEHLAQVLNITPQEIIESNCLISSHLFPDTVLYLPSIVFPTNTPLTTENVMCTHPPGWTLYTVKPGDTLTRISGLYGITVWQLKQANCLESNLIRSGQLLWVPPVPTRTFTATPSLTEQPISEAKATPTPQPTPTHLPPTLTPTDTFVPPTGTPTPSETPTPIPSFTAQASDTPMAEPSPTETFTASPTS